MNTLSKRKKLFRKRMNKKGFSSIVGALFMVLIVWSLASAYFFFTLSQNTNYNAAIRQKNQFDLDRLSEVVQVNHAAFSADSGYVNVEVRIKNSGPTTANLTALWVKVVKGGVTNYNSLPINLTIRSGESFAKSFTVPVSGVTPGGNIYASWFITARGNTVVAEPPAVEDIVVASTTQGIGALAMDFQNFTAYKIVKQGSSWYLDFASGVNAYNIKVSDAPMAFCVNFTNMDYPKARDLSLNKNSELFTIFPSTGGNYKAITWYIANVDQNTGQIQTSFTNQTLYWNIPTMVYFVTKEPVSGSLFDAKSFIASNEMFTGTAPVNLAITGMIGTSPFGQNIPFVSIYMTP